MSNKYLIISTSIELMRFLPDKIAYIEADGNYSKIHQVDGETRLLVLQLGKIAEAIDKQLGADRKPFARIGKSIIINCSFVYSINVPKKELVLSDMASFYHTVHTSEKTLKDLKNHFEIDKEKYYAKEL